MVKSDGVGNMKKAKEELTSSEAALEIIERVRLAGEEPTFGNMLREFLLSRYSPDGKADETALETYINYIIGEFSLRQVPAHFDLASGSLRKLSRNWLSRNSVSRKAVLIMGFGLGLSLKEVERFLTEGIGEHALNPKDPFETLYWYCVKNGQGYAAFEEKWEAYTYGNYGAVARADPNETTDRLRKIREGIDGDEKLYDYLRRIAVLREHRAQSRTARRHFKQLLAACVNLLRPENAPISADNDEDISSGGSIIENELYSSIPHDKNGNLKHTKAASLSNILRYNRLSRQRVRNLLLGQAEITRSDLITLCFLKVCLSGRTENANERAARFLDEAGGILLDCGMSPVNRKIPYELLLLLCMEREEPLYEFAEVMELCFAGGQGEEDD